MHATERWFGEGFQRLHPRLRELHRHGGVLEGPVTVVFGDGLAGRIGRRLAKRMGLPTSAGTTPLRVDIHSDQRALHWSRTFGDAQAMHSRFEPVGAWPQGYWLEDTGPVRLALDVVVDDGGWRWRPRATWVHGVRMPLAWMPRVDAGKRIDADGAYAFRVEVVLPWLGMALRYAGALRHRAR